MLRSPDCGTGTLASGGLAQPPPPRASAPPPRPPPPAAPLPPLHRPLCGPPRIAPGPPTDSILATGRTMGEAGRRRRGAVRLSAAVQVHRTASHERSPPPRLRSETRARPGGRSSTQGAFHLPHVRVGVALPPKSPVVHVPDGPEHLSLPPGPVMLPETPGDASSTGTTTSLPPWRRRY